MSGFSLDGRQDQAEISGDGKKRSVRRGVFWPNRAVIP
jgi:hypothetical protein